MHTTSSRGRHTHCRTARKRERHCGADKLAATQQVPAGTALRPHKEGAGTRRLQIVRNTGRNKSASPSHPHPSQTSSTCASWAAHHHLPHQQHTRLQVLANNGQRRSPVSALPLHAVVRTYFSRSSLLCTPAPGQPSSDRYLPRGDCGCVCGGGAVDNNIDSRCVSSSMTYAACFVQGVFTIQSKCQQSHSFRRHVDTNLTIFHKVLCLKSDLLLG
jgi:hypothetical protein